MRTAFKVKFLQYLTHKRQDDGFTLIELLVVIIIIGILSAIALPSFLSQAARSRQSEAKTNVGAMNRAQQAYYFEQQSFATGSDAIAKLGIGIADTDNYTYSAVSLTNGVANKAKAGNDDLKGYTGGVFKEITAGVTRAILCEADAASTDDPGSPANATYCGSSLTRMR